MSPSVAVRRRSGVALLLVLAAGIAAFWWASRRNEASPPLPSSATPAPDVAGAVASDGAAGAADSSPQPSVLLRPDGELWPRLDGIRFGLASVSKEEASRWRSWVAGGQQGAGPGSFAELAQVHTWQPLTGTREPDGSVRVRLPLAPADRYELEARGDGPLHYYAAAFTADAVPAELHPWRAAGLRVFDVAARARLLLRRVESAAREPHWQALLAREAPALLAAYDESALPIEDGALLAPLPPGPLEVVLLVDGVEAERRTLELAPGVVTEWRPEGVAQGVAQAVAVELQLALVEMPGEAPVEEVQVTWHGERGDQTRASDANGGVAFAAVDRQRRQRFTLAFPPEGELPRWPASLPLELEPESGEPRQGGRILHHRIELAPLQWLLLQGVASRPATPARGADPYPVYVLQRAAPQGWQDHAAEHFLPHAEGLAVSLAQPGEYRVLALDTPWTRRVSATVDARSGGGPFRVALQGATGHPCELTVLHDGRPLAGAPLHLVGPATGLPPRVLLTDGAGRVRLDGVNVTSLTVEVPGYAARAVDVGADTARVELAREASH